MGITSAAAGMLVALFFGVGDDVTFYKVRGIEVCRSYDYGNVGKVDAPKLRMTYVLCDGIYWGRQYGRPRSAAERGDPEKDLSRLPTTYWHPHGPFGSAMGKFNWFPGAPNTFHADARIAASLIGLGGDAASQLAALWSEPPVAVLGLNVGTQAGYARPYQTMHFVERNGDKIALSAPPADDKAYFDYVADARRRGALVKVFPGEHRATFAKVGGERFYHLIDVEAIKGGRHEDLDEELLTREAMQLLMGKLVEEGVLCYHTSHRHVDLVPLLAATARDCGYAAVVGKCQDARETDRGLFSSEWVLVARKKEYLAHLAPPPGAGATMFAPAHAEDRRHVWHDGARPSYAGLWRGNPYLSDLNRWARHAVLASTRDPRKAAERYTSIQRVLDAVDRLWVKANQLPPAPRAGIAGVPLELKMDLQGNPFGGPPLERHTLLYRHINIGFQFTRPHVAQDVGNPTADFSRLPTTYYHRLGPPGRAFELFNWFPASPPNTYHADARLPASLLGLGGQPYEQLVALWSEPPVAVLGLEVGTPAGYAHPFQTMHFTERHPQVVALSLPGETQAPAFTYVKDARGRGANVQVFTGPPRPAFAEHGGERFYRLILAELYKDSINNLHEDLLTREGLAMLMSKASEDGIVCFHISNRYFRGRLRITSSLLYTDS